MYKVNFVPFRENETKDSESVLLCTSDSLDESLGFALSLHRVSNVPHVVRLVSVDEEFPSNVILNLRSKDAK